VTTESTPVSATEHFEPGARCLIEVLDRRYLSTVLNVAEDRLRLTFPTLDFPIDGMYVILEFHDDDGFTTYETEVISGPHQVGDGLLVKCPPAEYRSRHRSAWRVPGDFSVQLKGHVHPRRHEAPVVNVSTGGLLVKTHADVDLGDNVDLRFSLPKVEEELIMVGHVVHCAAEDKGADHGRLVGMQFVSPDPAHVDQIRAYIRRRLRTLYPSSSRLYGPRGGDVSDS
jgi:Tfp pilus assembly protein PilZ